MRLELLAQLVTDSAYQSRGRANLEEKHDEGAFFAVVRAAGEKKENNDGVSRDSDGAGHRQSKVLGAAYENPVNGQVGESQYSANDGGNPRIACSVKAARENVLRTPAK